MKKIVFVLSFVQSVIFACPDFSGIWNMECTAQGSTTVTQAVIPVTQKACEEVFMNGQPLGLTEPNITLKETGGAHNQKITQTSVYSAHWEGNTLLFRYKLVEKLFLGAGKELKTGFGGISLQADGSIKNTYRVKGNPVETLCLGKK